MSEKPLSLKGMAQKLKDFEEKLMADCGQGKCYEAGDYTCRVSQIRQELETLAKQLENRLNVVIRILQLHKREEYARRALFELHGELIGGHPLPSEWKESDWFYNNILAKTRKKK